MSDHTDDEDYVTINVDVLRATIGAVHCRCADNVPRWIPRSLIFGPQECRIVNDGGKLCSLKVVGKLCSLKVMRWFVQKEGIPIARKDIA